MVGSWIADVKGISVLGMKSYIGSVKSSEPSTTKPFTFPDCLQTLDIVTAIKKEKACGHKEPSNVKPNTSTRNLDGEVKLDLYYGVLNISGVGGRLSARTLGKAIAGLFNSFDVICAVNS